MTKHTPGPWVISANNPRLVKHASGPVLAECGPVNAGEAFANARLIAAAPCMAEALQALIACDFGARGWDDDAEQAAMQARAAIAKATS